MNKLKNIGITALAGTLVSLSAAQAGGVSINGNWEMSYVNLDHTQVTGGKIGINKNLSFGTSGDLSDGGGVTWATTVGGSDTLGLSSASMNINMGGIATLAYDSGTGGYGANAVDNVVPTAWEEIDYGFSTGISDVGAVSASKGVVNLTVKAPVAGTGFSLSWAPRIGSGHQGDGATGSDSGNNQGIDVVLDFVDYSAPHAGFRWGFAGQMEIPQMTAERARKDLNVGAAFGNDDTSEELHTSGTYKGNPYAGTMYMKTQLGPLHLGVQGTFKNPQLDAQSAVMNQRTIVTGAALVFGDTLSLSYGTAWDKYRYNDRNRGLGAQVGTSENAGINNQTGGHAVLGGEEHEYITHRFHGWSAAINMGPVALKATRNKVDGQEASSIYEHAKTHSELNLSIAF